MLERQQRVDRVGDQREKRWKRQVECRYYVELEGAEPERGMKLLPRETADPSLPPSPSRSLAILASPPRDPGEGGGWGLRVVSQPLHEPRGYDAARERSIVVTRRYPLSESKTKQRESSQSYNRIESNRIDFPEN